MVSDDEERRWTATQIKEYIEALLDEKDRALSMADGEREKAASALRGEQQRALDQADRERDKAAEQLRIELSRSIKEGDERLREHIANQIMQINAALVSGELLEKERLGSTHNSILALKEQLDVLRVAAVVAQDKFEHSVESRFSQVNEFRAALDDLGKTMATRREMETAVTNLQEIVEKARQERQNQIDDLRETMLELRSRLDVGPVALAQLQQQSDRAAGRQIGIGSSANFVVVAVGLIATILGIVVVLANVLTT